LHLVALYGEEHGWGGDLGVDRALGAVAALTVSQPDYGSPLATHVDGEVLFGPFDLWDGQWWRIPISGFHHAGFVHLIVNCLSMVTLGQLLERRMPRWLYAL